MRTTVLKNVLLSCGGYFVAAGLLHAPLVWLWSFVSNHLTFTVGIETIVLMPVVMGLPEILVACLAGAAIASTVEAAHPSRWALVPAMFFMLQRVFAQRWWAQPPTANDRAAMLVEAALPVIACILTATFVEARLRRTPPNLALHPTAEVNPPVGRG
jgi:hypothetical protein